MKDIVHYAPDFYDEEAVCGAPRAFDYETGEPSADGLTITARGEDATCPECYDIFRERHESALSIWDDLAIMAAEGK